jgi:hypothetical protein
VLFPFRRQGARTASPDEQRGSQPPSVRAAVAKFAIAGVLALVVLGGISVLVLGEISRMQAVKEAKRLTELVGRELVQPHLSDGLLRGDRKAVARLDRIVRSRVLGRDFVRVKLWGPDGRILYSDRPALVGTRYQLGADDLEVLRHGGVAAGISDLSRPENRFERRSGKLLEVYMPVRTPDGRPTAGRNEPQRSRPDLHDGTVQELVAASYALSAAREHVSDNDAADALGRAEATCRGAVTGGRCYKSATRRRAASRPTARSWSPPCA